MSGDLLKKLIPMLHYALNPGGFFRASRRPLGIAQNCLPVAGIPVLPDGISRIWIRHILFRTCLDDFGPAPERGIGMRQFV